MKEKQPYQFKEQFFSQIYDDYIDRIYRFVYLKVNSKSAAEDITAETFTRLWKQIYLDKEVKNPSAFLFASAKNLLIDYYRVKDKQPDALGESAHLIQDENQDIEKSALLASDLQEIQNALNQLSDDYRQAVSLYYIDQLPVSDVAKSLGKSMGATRVTISRGMKQLRQILEA